MVKLKLQKKPDIRVEYYKGIYIPDNEPDDLEYSFTIQVITTIETKDVSLGEITWDDDVEPPTELLAEDFILEHFFDINKN